MIKTINFGNHSVEVNTSAGWLYAYRQQFGNDVLQDIYPLLVGVLETLSENHAKNGENLDVGVAYDILIRLASLELTTVYNIFWAMAANQNRNIKPPISFFNQFDTFPVDIILPEIFVMLIESSVSSKNAKSLLESLTTAKESISISSPSQESIEG